MSVVTTEVATLAVLEDCCSGAGGGSGAGGPMVSPANAMELPANSTHTNTRAFSGFNIRTSEVGLYLTC